MLPLFKKRYTYSQGNTIDARWWYIQRQYQKQLDQINIRSRRAVTAVSSNHFLNKIIMLMDIPTQYPIETYVGNIDNRINSVHRALKITSSVIYGGVHPGYLYKNNREIYILDDSVFDIYAAETYWQKLRPLRILYHPFTDLGMLHNGHQETGVVTISVNIHELMIMYRGFKRYQEMNEGGLGSVHFVSMYLLPLLLYSQLDVALFNRVIALLNHQPPSTNTDRHVIHVLNYDTQIDNLLADIIQKQQRSGFTFDDMLLSLPAFSEDTMLQSLVLPDIAQTRQALWALYLARLPVIEGLIQLGQQRAISRNSGYLSQLKSDIRLLNSSNVYSHLPTDIRGQAERSLRVLMNPSRMLTA